MMILSERLRALRQEKNMSQGDIEEKTGLLRCYISRVENGHTVPSVATLEKWAGALGIPMYRLFFEGAKPKAFPIKMPATLPLEDSAEMRKLRGLLAKMNSKDRLLLLHTAKNMASRRKSDASVRR